MYKIYSVGLQAQKERKVKTHIAVRTKTLRCDRSGRASPPHRAAATMLGFWFVGWGVADEVRRCVRVEVV
jgi:hypothetical protein